MNLKALIKKWINWLTGKDSSRKFALIVFAWTLMCGLLIQKVALPFIFPQMHAGMGLLKGTDGVKFHRIMLELSQVIQQGGWNAWQLHPGGQAVAGIGAVFYTLIAPEPWVLLPWNALLHGLAAFFMVELGKLVFKDCKLALASALPLAFYPSAFTWTAQMHNENYTVLGSVMVLYGAVMSLHPEGKQFSVKRVSSLAGMALGLFMIFILREWMFQALNAMVIMSLLLITVIILISNIIGRKNWGQTSGNPTFTLLTIILLSALQIVFSRIEFSAESEFLLAEGEKSEVVIKDKPSTPQRLRKTDLDWQPTTGIPEFVDEKMREMALKRANQLFKFPSGNTNFDEAVSLNSTSAILGYAPRAAMIGLLSPFPDLWFSSSEKATSGLTRAVSGVEMVLAYALLPGMVLAGFRYRRESGFWVTVLICMGMMTILAIGMPNLGTLYRFRYPFFSVVVGIGAAGWLCLIAKKNT